MCWGKDLWWRLECYLSGQCVPCLFSIIFSGRAVVVSWGLLARSCCATRYSSKRSSNASSSTHSIINCSILSKALHTDKKDRGRQRGGNKSDMKQQQRQNGHKGYSFCCNSKVSSDLARGGLAITNGVRTEAAALLKAAFFLGLNAVIIHLWCCFKGRRIVSRRGIRVDVEWQKAGKSRKSKSEKRDWMRCCLITTIAEKEVEGLTDLSRRTLTYVIVYFSTYSPGGYIKLILVTPEQAKESWDREYKSQCLGTILGVRNSGQIGNS